MQDSAVHRELDAPLCAIDGGKNGILLGMEDRQGSNVRKSCVSVEALFPHVPKQPLIWEFSISILASKTCVPMKCRIGKW
ncbi:hypothetical protein ACIQW5_19170 [Methylorubrum thiocyanatum]|uniref:hypothetical protein n=1 Tax=Methylorubrum thiocyanatum TaxID=47958 RepID=UPI00383A14A7